MLSKDSKPISGSETTLSWDDLLYLHKRNFCLRAVNNEQDAYREQEKGGRGDAVSLATFAYPGANCESKIFNYLQKRNYLQQGDDIDSCYSIICTWLANDLFKSDEFSEERSELIARMHDGINLLVMQAFEYSQKPGFLLLRFDDYMFPYEIGDRYPLGKMGKRNFNSDAVQAVIKGSGNCWDVDSAVNAIVSKIKSLRLSYVEQQEWVQKNTAENGASYNDYLEWERQQLVYEAAMKRYEAEMKKYVAEVEKRENEAGSIKDLSTWLYAFLKFNF